MKIKILNKNNLINENLSISSKYALSNLKEYETVDGEVYRKNFNETLDSATILIDNLPEKIDIEPYDEVIFDDTYSGKVVSPFANKTHRMLVDDFRETMVSVYPKIYKYEISLFSKTKLLEGAICPNLSITPLRVGTKRSINDYIQQYMNLYCPKKRIKNGSGYNVEPIISISQNIATKFSDDCPELQWNTPTLREVLNDLFILKDCVPIVNANNELDFLDLTKTNRDISELDTINYIERSQSSKDYVSEIYMNMVNVMNTSVPNVRNTVNTSEYIPFNATNYVATSENIILKTKFPIQNIKHLYMVFVATINTVANENIAYNPILQKVDLTNITYKKSLLDYTVNGSDDILNGNFVKELNDYNSLKIAYRKDDMVENLDQYQNCCLYYTRYGNEIKGFTKQTKNAPFLFFDTEIASTLQILKRLSNISVSVPSSDYHLNNDAYTGEINTNFSTFFQIEYETTAEAVFKASKTNQPSNSRTIIDNQSYSFVDAYSQGFMEYQKVNRLGNQVLMINQRLDTSANGTLIDIGDYYIENGEKFIVYSVEYQNHRHHIEVNAQATKDYILRNYFTGVKQKIRTWINAQDEAHIRNEHTKIQIELNSTNKEDDNISKFGWTGFFTTPLLMSGISTETEKPSDVVTKIFDGNKTLPDTNNFYYVDSVFRVVGNSIIISTGFDDNFTVGKGIDTTVADNIEYSIDGDVIKYPKIITDDEAEQYGGVPLQNGYYVDNNGEFENIKFYIGKQVEIKNNDLSQFTNCQISSNNGNQHFVTIDTNLINDATQVVNTALNIAVNNNQAFIYINNIKYTLYLDRNQLPNYVWYFQSSGSFSVGTRGTIYPLVIRSSNFEDTNVYIETNNIIKDFLNFPKLRNQLFRTTASYQNSCRKDNKDIFRQNIQLEYLSGTDNIYFTSKFIERNNFVVLGKTAIRIYYSDTYIKGSLDLPSSKTLDTNATLTVNENGQISLRNIPSGKAYYITDASDNVILATNGITQFYVNIRCILNDNIYDDNGIIIDKL